MGEVKKQRWLITIQLPEEKYNELCEMALRTGITVTSIARSGVYKEIETLKAA